jgi:putative tryptophan/tyrosine transport system substrate-binding protein
MRRRELITLLGGAATTGAWPLAARAQQRTVPVIGFLSSVSPDGFEDRLRAFRQGLKEVDYVEGENVAIEYRWAENRLDRLPTLGGELVRRQVSVITASGGTAGAIAAKALNTTIPIVFGIPEDPVKLGLVASLARPGSNMTGVNFFAGEVLAKRLELLRELVPQTSRVAVFVNPANPARAETQVNELQTAARAMGLQTRIFNTSTGREINAAFATFAQEPPDALFVSADPFFVVRRIQLANLAARHGLPSSFSVRDNAQAGGLMSYGTDISDAYRQIGVYTGRVLKGAKPADLPVLQSTKFELVLNVQTATMLGIEIPSTLLARADEVIE